MLQRDVYCRRPLRGTVCRSEWRLAVTGEQHEQPGLDGRHRDKDGEISSKHGNTLVRTLRKMYGQGFAAGYPDTAKLSEVLLQLKETSLSQLRRESRDRPLEHKIGQASKVRARREMRCESSLPR